MKIKAILNVLDTNNSSLICTQKEFPLLTHVKDRWTQGVKNRTKAIRADELSTSIDPHQWM